MKSKIILMLLVVALLAGTAALFIRSPKRLAKEGLASAAAQLSQINIDKAKVFIEAIDNGNIAELESFDKKEDADIAPFLMVRAILAGKLDIVQLLVDKKGVNINSTNKLGYSPIYFAATSNNVELVKYILDKGADVNTVAHGGMTPIYAAVGSGSLEVVKLLESHGAKFDIKVEHSFGLLQLAAFVGKQDVIAYLLEKGFDINKTDASGSAALHIAALKGDLEVVTFLLEQGADIALKNNDGKTALDLAQEVKASDDPMKHEGHDNIVAFLEKKTQ